MKNLLIAMLLVCGSVFAQEQIVSYDDNSLPVLNEELRRSADTAAKTDREVELLRNRVSDIDAKIAALVGKTTIDKLIQRIETLESDVANIDMPAFGAWETKSNGTTYKAASDGFVVATNNDFEEIKGYTDAKASPTTLVAILGKIGDGLSPWDSYLTFPVRKGDYWKVTGCDTVRWIPLE